MYNQPLSKKEKKMRKDFISSLKESLIDVDLRIMIYKFYTGGGDKYINIINKDGSLYFTVGNEAEYPYAMYKIRTRKWSELNLNYWLNECYCKDGFWYNMSDNIVTGEINDCIYDKILLWNESIIDDFLEEMIFDDVTIGVI